jgi:3-deoxy-manno-octulosonate cytidylyltransferase (CMP-KDO synthetase)
MSFVVVIPARYASTRLPGKPLRMIGDWPMIRHVYERARQSRAEAVYIATDSPEIMQAAATFTGNVILTGDHHQSGTDRIQEVVTKLALDEHSIVVNVQGDEPLIPPALIDQVADDLMAHTDAGISSLYEPIDDPLSLHNPNVVKVVTDAKGYALYFSRSPLPWHDPQAGATGEAKVSALRHIGIYAYRVATLNAFVAWSPSLLERTERLEQLRALHNGVKIHMLSANVAAPGGVDTEEDLARILEHLQRQSSQPKQTGPANGR